MDNPNDTKTRKEILCRVPNINGKRVASTLTYVSLLINMEIKKNMPHLVTLWN